LPGYIYTLLPFLLIQENEFMVRLPAAIAGILIVLITYKIGLSLFEKKYALLLSLVIALSPLAIFYSRMAWEANLGLMWSLLSLYLLFFHQPGKTKFKLHSDIMAVLAVILAIVTYNTPLIYLPIVILLVILTRVKLSYKEFLPLTIILSGILIFFLIAFNNLNSQKTGIIIFTDPTVWQQYVEYRNSLSSALVPLFGNKYVYWLKIMINNVMKTLSYKFLVSAGGSHPWH
jgi:4-amino-4-deoxy-L-arabinose transferase-like glycosyltransferase